MATLPKIFQNYNVPAERAVPARAERDVCGLRPLPQESVFFYCKKIDNSRLVREPDPKALGDCWGVIRAACLGVVLLTGVLVPRVAITMNGYKLESLREEERRLLDERRELELQEAQLLSPERLERLAKGQNLVTPSSNQVFHLETRADGAVAMAKK
jgi:cell division protein FtsL